MSGGARGIVILKEFTAQEHVLTQKHPKPYTIAGFFTVWLGEEDAFPASLGLGDISRSLKLELPQELVKDFHAYRLPTPDQLLAVGNYFTSATHITLHRHRLGHRIP